MTTGKPSIPFFTDNDVDNEVSDVLMDSGHMVTRLRDVMLDNSPDPVVATACREAGLVLITHNIKHFRKIVKDHEVSKSQADRLCRIELGCRQFEAVERIKCAMEIIEMEWQRLGKDKAGLRIFIGDGIIRIHR